VRKKRYVIDAVEQCREMMTCLLACADKSQNPTIVACQGHGCDRGGRCGASRRNFPTVQNPGGSSSVGIEHHNYT
jgi:hypothetical protein